MERFSYYLVKKLIEFSNIQVESDDIEVYVYGLLSFLYPIIPTSLLLFTSFIIKKPFEIILWIFIFLTLRKYAGGMHAKTPIVCFFSSAALGLSALIMCSCIAPIHTILYFVIVICNFVPLLILAPATAKEFTNKHRKICKIKLGTIIIIITTILCPAPFARNYYLHALISTTILCIAQKIQK